MGLVIDFVGVLVVCLCCDASQSYVVGGLLVLLVVFDARLCLGLFGCLVCDDVFQCLL